MNPFLLVASCRRRQSGGEEESKREGVTSALAWGVVKPIDSLVTTSKLAHSDRMEIFFPDLLSKV